MKFLRPRPFAGTTVDQGLKFLRVDLAKIFSDMVEGFRHLTFKENFDSFEADVVIAGSATAAIPNRLRTKALKWFPVRILGDSRLIEGAEFTDDFVYIKNASSTETRATLVFMR